MDYKIGRDGIAVFKKAFTDKECAFFINAWHMYKENNQTFHHGHEDVTDERVSLLNCYTENRDLGGFIERVWEHYPKYVNKFKTLSTMPVQINSVKIQRTNIGEGYHIWHHESSSPAYMNRLWVAMLYCNTVDEGGETEFLTQSVRLKATAGDLVIFPASYTHIHRGNPPISNEKYIVTSWGEYANK